MGFDSPQGSRSLDAVGQWCIDHAGRKTGAWTELTPECRAELRRVNLHWHDLRHEYASRLVERGVPLAQVRDLLGHASITTTERYDNQTLEALQAAAARLEAGKSFDTAGEAGPRTDFQESFKNDPAEPRSAGSVSTDQTPDNQLKDGDLEGWYRYGDSNPGPVAEKRRR